MIPMVAHVLMMVVSGLSVVLFSIDIIHTIKLMLWLRSSLTVKFTNYEVRAFACT